MYLYIECSHCVIFAIRTKAFFHPTFSCFSLTSKSIKIVVFSLSTVLQAKLIYSLTLFKISILKKLLPFSFLLYITITEGNPNKNSYESTFEIACTTWKLILLLEASLNYLSSIFFWLTVRELYLVIRITRSRHPNHLAYR